MNTNASGIPGPFDIKVDRNSKNPLTRCTGYWIVERGEDHTADVIDGLRTPDLFELFTDAVWDNDGNPVWGDSHHAGGGEREIVLVEALMRMRWDGVTLACNLVPRPGYSGDDNWRNPDWFIQLRRVTDKAKVAWLDAIGYTGYPPPILPLVESMPLPAMALAYTDLAHRCPVTDAQVIGMLTDPMYLEAVKDLSVTESETLISLSSQWSNGSTGLLAAARNL